MAEHEGAVLPSARIGRDDEPLHVPVVSRVDEHELLGVVSLDDVRRAYQFVDAPESPSASGI